MFGKSLVKIKTFFLLLLYPDTTGGSLRSPVLILLENFIYTSNLDFIILPILLKDQRKEEEYVCMGSSVWRYWGIV